MLRPIMLIGALALLLAACGDSATTRGVTGGLLGAGVGGAAGGGTGAAIGGAAGAATGVLTTEDDDED